MSRTFFRITLMLAFCLAMVYGCATPLPSTYNVSDTGDVVDGPVLALAGERDLVVAVNHDGLFMKKGVGPWKKHEVPGVRNFSKITCLAVADGVVYLGSDGEGLHIFSDGTWEVKTSRYGGLPDDGVLSLAIDGNEEGLPGVSLWVGTRKGIAAYREGNWFIYRPGEDWLVAMTGKPGPGAGKVYVGPAFKLGKKGGDSNSFKPPVSAISVGPDRVVFGNRNSGLAVVSEYAVSTVKFTEERRFTHLLVNKDVIWAGTENGLLWGGLSDHAKGKPWPINKTYDMWSGTLFGSRNTQPFQYRWKLLGYNNARVVGLMSRENDLWTAYRSETVSRAMQPKKLGSSSETDDENQISTVRLFISIDEYIARRQTPAYEVYGIGAGLKGKPTALYVTPDGRKVYVGTTKGLWGLEQ